MWSGLIFALVAVSGTQAQGLAEITVQEQWLTWQDNHTVTNERAHSKDLPELVIQEEWMAWKAEHGKTYQSMDEEGERVKIFMENKRLIAQHNARYHRHLESFTMKMNHFGDMRADEIPMGINHEMTEEMYAFVGNTNVSLPEEMEQLEDVPTSWDWRTRGAVTPVKNQGTCGSCWTFAATGVIEAANFLKSGQLVSFSEQQLMDCVGRYNSYAKATLDRYPCRGGWYYWAFNYVKRQGGINAEADYPYHANYQYRRCRYNSRKYRGTVSTYRRLPSGNEQVLKQAVATKMPVAVAIGITPDIYRFYSSGVFKVSNCPRTSSHAVLVVGYGTTDDGQDYWLVKNSWGAGWGDRGYIKMARNYNNMCNIASWGYYAVA